MRTKVTLILVLLNVALLAVIIYARHQWQAEQELARLSKRVLGSETVGINSLTITSAGNDREIRLERDGVNSPWELRVPINWPANDFAVRRIIHELEFLESETSFPVSGLAQNHQTLADYGLNPPRLTLNFTRPSSVAGAPAIATKLEIGDTNKVGNRLYVLSPDGQTIHVVGHSLAESLIVGMEDLRTDTLFTIPVFEVRWLGLQNAAPAPRVRLRHDGAHWTFESPIAARAGKAASEVVVSGLNGLRVANFLPDAVTADTGLDKPELRVTLEGNNRRETLLVGRSLTVDATVKRDPANPATPYYARMVRTEERPDERPQVFVTMIPNRLFETMHLAQEKLRDTRILDFDPLAVSAISLSAPGMAEPLMLRRDDAGNWRIVRATGLTELPADNKLVGNLILRLALLSVIRPSADESGFLRDAPSAAEVENYGFNLPQRTITLTLAPASPGATPPTTTLQLGVGSASGGTVQARVVSQPFIYAVAPDTLNDFPVSAAFYRDRILRTLPEGTRITGLTLVDNDAPEKPLVSLKLADGQSWDAALAGETESRRAALKTVLDGVTTLRAKQFVADSFSDTTYVDGKPTPWKYTLETTLALGGAAGTPQTSTTTLKIAERSGGGAQLIGSKEFSVIFSVEQTLLDALWTLTYGERDPGPPALPPTQPAAAP
ncbi:MAG: DUF4340 domain-containing protein [Opitutaceae bacterium]|jgi:hypothetical protein